MNYAAWLASVPGLGSNKILLLYRNFSCAQEIYECSPELLRKAEGLQEKDVERIISFKKHMSATAVEEKLCDLHVLFTSIEDADYPERLRSLVDLPYGLFYKGALPDPKQKAVAIVGSRGRSAYGEGFAMRLGERLGELGIPVISGLALGIDADAHKGALKSGGKTYGVLACGVENCYPRSNRFLYEEMLLSCGVISEYPPKTEPMSFLFPMRNRIIAGLSDVVVVAEAKEKSGSLITADMAMEQGKDVYALPGRIQDTLSSGCNRLIKQGAGIVVGVEDFLEDCQIIFAQKCIQMDFRKNLLEKEESLVYSLLDFCPVSLGSLMDKTTLSLTEILEITKRLKDMGLAEEKLPNYYVRTF